MPVTAKDAADDCLARARGVLGTAATSGGARDDVARMALVMGVAALDTYMHAVVRARLSYNRGALPNALLRLDLPFEELTSLAETALAAQRAGRSTRPWVQVTNALHRRLLTATFQSCRGVEWAMALAGVGNVWNQVATGLNCTADEVKARLTSIVHRRNQIVHEGDLRRLVRPRQVDYNCIDAAQVPADLHWLAELIAALDSIL